MSSADDRFETRSIDNLPFAMVITDPNLDDNPIIYVNREFQRITHYSDHFSVGRNCRFLQGEDTDPAAVRKLSQGIRNRQNVTVDLLNYRADGTTFMNRLLVSPLFDGDGHLVNYFGIQRALEEGEQEVAAPDEVNVDSALQEIQHRVKNHLTMVVSMIRMHARRAQDRDIFQDIGRRVEALALLYEELSVKRNNLKEGLRDSIPLGAYLSRVSSTIIALDGRTGINVGTDFDEIVVDTDLAAQLGLLISELLTNALRHAFVDRETGEIQIELRRLSGQILRLMVSDDGVGFPKDSSWPDAAVDDERAGLGARVVSSLARGLDASIDVNSRNRGTMIVIDVPYRWEADERSEDGRHAVRMQEIDATLQKAPQSIEG